MLSATPAISLPNEPSCCHRDSTYKKCLFRSLIRNEIQTPIIGFIHAPSFFSDHFRKQSWPSLICWRSCSAKLSSVYLGGRFLKSPGSVTVSARVMFLVTRLLPTPSNRWQLFCQCRNHTRYQQHRLWQWETFPIAVVRPHLTWSFTASDLKRGTFWAVTRKPKFQCSGESNELCWWSLW